MIGIIIGVVAVLATFLLKGVSPVILINLPSIFIVIVGSCGAVIASFGMAEFKKAPSPSPIALDARACSPSRPTSRPSPIRS